jgi:excisionase family DNA binding protein
MSDFQHISEVLPKVMERLDQIYQNTLKSSRPFLDLDQASQYLSISKYTIYSFCSKRQIPHYKRGRRLFFAKEELDSWILDRKNRFKSHQEIEREACNRIIRDEF